jgi:hypothetical protein
VIESKDLRTLALFGLLTAAVFAVLGAVGNYMDARREASREAPDPGPPGWMVDDLMAEARQITKDAADGTTAG